MGTTTKNHSRLAIMLRRASRMSHKMRQRGTPVRIFTAANGDESYMPALGRIHHTPSRSKYEPHVGAREKARKCLA